MHGLHDCTAQKAHTASRLSSKTRSGFSSHVPSHHFTNSTIMARLAVFRVTRRLLRPGRSKRGLVPCGPCDPGDPDAVLSITHPVSTVREVFATIRISYRRRLSHEREGSVTITDHTAHAGDADDSYDPGDPGGNAYQGDLGDPGGNAYQAMRATRAIQAGNVTVGWNPALDGPSAHPALTSSESNREPDERGNSQPSLRARFITGRPCSARDYSDEFCKQDSSL